jgi:Putative endonuclease segE, GIY-YIG domain
MTEWLYKTNSMYSEITEVPEGYQGFVYLIEDIHTGKKYVGKKNFYSTTRVKQKGKTRRKVVKKESDWKTYYGSSDSLKKDVEEYGKERFARHIIKLCKSKSEMSYFETKEIFERDALLKEEYYNSWVSARIHGDNLKSIHLI